MDWACGQNPLDKGEAKTLAMLFPKKDLSGSISTAVSDEQLSLALFCDQEEVETGYPHLISITPKRRNSIVQAALDLQGLMINDPSIGCWGGSFF